MLAQSLLEGFKKLVESKTFGVRNSGSVKLLESGEEKTVLGTKRTLEILEDEEQLEALLKSEGKDLSVSMGDENESLSNVALVKAPLVVSGKQVGTIGVMGPQRMDYSLIASALKFLTNEMENLEVLEDRK